jgi:MFS family permease
MFYSPLRYSIYRSIWIATLVSNIGTWIHTVTASLLMAELTNSAVIIAMVQTAAMLPILLFAIPGGVIADFRERKHIIIYAHTFMSMIAFLMAAITYSGYMSEWLLLSALFLLNIGLAFNQPAWQAISARLVPAKEIKQTAVLNNLSFNVSRCIGPAIAGYLFSYLGAAPLFALNGLSFIGVIIMFSLKVEAQPKPATPALTLTSVLRGFSDGIQFFHDIPLFRTIVCKSTCYFTLASSVFALLPYVVLIQNKMNPNNLGLLTGAAGLGAVLNAVFIHRLRELLTDHFMTTLAMFLTCLTIASIAIFQTTSLLFCAMLLFGFCWSLTISVYNGTLQADFPDHIRSRLLGIYFVSFAAAQALGSYASGNLTQAVGTTPALMLIAGAMLITAIGYAAKRHTNSFLPHGVTNNHALFSPENPPPDKHSQGAGF